VPGSRRIDHAIAGDREAFHIAREKFLGPPQITAQRIERNIFRHEPKLCLEGSLRLLQGRRPGHGAAGQGCVEHHLERSRTDMGGVEREQSNLVLAVQNHPAEDEILVRVGSSR